MTMSLDCVQGGKAAAETILDMRMTGDFSKASCKEYARRWNAAFGFDFKNVGISDPYPSVKTQRKGARVFASFLSGQSYYLRLHNFYVVMHIRLEQAI